MNKPYVKKYNSKGEVTNPITKENPYRPEYPNRSVRRQRKKRFHGESKNFHLTVTKISKHQRKRQVITCKDGRKKVIEHYIPR